MKSKEEMASEASKEGESAETEASEYQHIDDFVETLDGPEIKYLKEKLNKIEQNPSLEKVEAKEKEYSAKDFED